MTDEAPRLRPSPDLQEEWMMTQAVLYHSILRRLPVLPDSFVAFCVIEAISKRRLDPGRHRKLKAIYDRPERCDADACAPRPAEEPAS